MPVYTRSQRKKTVQTELRQKYFFKNRSSKLRKEAGAIIFLQLNETKTIREVLEKSAENVTLNSEVVLEQRIHSPKGKPKIKKQQKNAELLFCANPSLKKTMQDNVTTDEVKTWYNGAMFNGNANNTMYETFE